MAINIVCVGISTLMCTIFNWWKTVELKSNHIIHSQLNFGAACECECHFTSFPCSCCLTAVWSPGAPERSTPTIASTTRKIHLPYREHSNHLTSKHASTCVWLIYLFMIFNFHRFSPEFIHGQFLPEKTGRAKAIVFPLTHIMSVNRIFSSYYVTKLDKVA